MSKGCRIRFRVCHLCCSKDFAVQIDRTIVRQASGEPLRIGSIWGIDDGRGGEMFAGKVGFKVSLGTAHGG